MLQRGMSVQNGIVRFDYGRGDLLLRLFTVCEMGIESLHKMSSATFLIAFAVLISFILSHSKCKPEVQDKLRSLVWISFHTQWKVFP